MDEEARRKLIADATIQHARAEIQRARTNLSLGFVLVGLGLGIAGAAALLPLGLVGKVVIAGIGFVLIPGGLAVIVKAIAAIARGKQKLHEYDPPSARVLSK